MNEAYCCEVARRWIFDYPRSPSAYWQAYWDLPPYWRGYHRGWNGITSIWDIDLLTEFMSDEFWRGMRDGLVANQQSKGELAV